MPVAWQGKTLSSLQKPPAMQTPWGLSNKSYSRGASGLAGFDLDLMDQVLGVLLDLQVTYRFYPDIVSAMVGVSNSDCAMAVGGFKLSESFASCPDMTLSGTVTTLTELPASDYRQTAYQSRASNATCLEYSIPYYTSGYAIMSFSGEIKQSFSGLVLNNALLNTVTPIFIGMFGFAIVFRFLEWHNPSARTLADSLYYSLVTIATVGYGDITPLSRAGRSLASVMMIFGTIALICVSAAVSSALVIGGLRTVTIDSLSQVPASGLCINKADAVLNEWIGSQYGIAVNAVTGAVGAPIIRASVEDCVSMLKNGTATAVVAEQPLLNWMASALYANNNFYVSGNIFEQYISWVFPGRSPLRSYVQTALITTMTQPAYIATRLQLGSLWFTSPAPASSKGSVPIDWPTLKVALVLCGFCLLVMTIEFALQWYRSQSGDQIVLLFGLVKFHRTRRFDRVSTVRLNTHHEASQLTMEALLSDSKDLVQRLAALAGTLEGQSATTSNQDTARILDFNKLTLRRITKQARGLLCEELLEVRQYAHVWEAKEVEDAPAEESLNS